MNLLSSRLHLANKQLDTYSADCPTAWSKNSTRTTKLGPGDVDYYFNNLGFRCDNFEANSTENIVFLGCSHTMGLGIPYQDTWAYKLHNRISKESPYWNLGFEKSSIDAQVLLLKELAPKLNPSKIFFLMPNLYRRLIYNSKGLLHYSPMIGQDRKFFDPNNEYALFNIDKLESLLLDQTYALFQLKIYLSLLDLLAKQYCSKVYLLHWYMTTDLEKQLINNVVAGFSNIKELKTEWKIQDWARDKMHFGPISHGLFAEDILEEISRL